MPFEQFAPNSAVDENKHASAAYERLRELLDSTMPRTWLFAGDNLGYSPAVIRRSYVEHVGDYLKTTTGRKLDVVIDVTISESSIHSLSSSAEWRLTKYQPDVVCLIPGLDDIKAGQAGLRSFAESIRNIAQFLENEGSILILMTPPLNLAAAHPPYCDLPAYVIVMRELASSLGILIIDHWRYLHVSRKTKNVESWLSPDGTQLLEEGHRRIARFTLRSLGLVADQ